jgi:hypothetical protein
LMPNRVGSNWVNCSSLVYPQQLILT